MELILRQLNHDDEEAFFDGLNEWEGEDLDWYTFSWKPGMKFSEMIGLLEKEFAGLDLAPGRVPHSMLYAFVSGKIVGRVSVRHRLNESLRRRNGNVGYAVAPKHRKNGYASEMLRQALEHCKSLGMSSVMITCADTNTPSWRIIEKSGGKLEETFWDEEEEEMVRRYWISI